MIRDVAASNQNNQNASWNLFFTHISSFELSMAIKTLIKQQVTLEPI